MKCQCALCVWYEKCANGNRIKSLTSISRSKFLEFFVFVDFVHSVVFVLPHNILFLFPRLSTSSFLLLPIRFIIKVAATLFLCFCEAVIPNNINQTAAFNPVHDIYKMPDNNHISHNTKYEIPNSLYSSCFRGRLLTLNIVHEYYKYSSCHFAIQPAITIIV